MKEQTRNIICGVHKDQQWYIYLTNICYVAVYRKKVVTLKGKWRKGFGIIGT